MGTKIRIFNSNVKSVLLYGAETWTLTKQIVLHQWLPKKDHGNPLARHHQECSAMEENKTATHRQRDFAKKMAVDRAHLTQASPASYSPSASMETKVHLGKRA